MGHFLALGPVWDIEFGWVLGLHVVGRFFLVCFSGSGDWGISHVTS